MLPREEEFLCKQLEQIFPNHDQLVIRQTVVNVSRHVNHLDASLERCIEELVNITYTGPRKYTSKWDSQVLSHIQSDVMNDLKQIFPNYDDKVIRTAVCHPSNLFEPLAKQALLQRCIDDLLDRRTAAEAGVDVDIDYGATSQDVTDFGSGLESRNSMHKVDFMSDGKDDSFDDDEFPSVAGIIGVKMKFSTTKPPPDVINIGDGSENSNQTAPAVKPESNMGFNATVAGISLSEKRSTADMKFPAVPPVKNKTKSETEDQSGKPDIPDKQPSDLNISVPLSGRNFISTKDDVFSCRTIESSDSDILSESSSDSVDSQQEAVDLPQITFPKTRHLHHNEILSSPTGSSRDLKLQTTTTTTNAHVSTACNSTAIPLKVCSGAFDSGRNFNIKPTKFTLTSSSDHLTDHTLKNASAFPFVNKEKVQTECLGIHSQGISKPDSGLSSPLVSSTIQGSLTAPGASGNQQTVTIESTHKITYNNPPPENVIRQNQCGSMKGYGGARSNYCSNITVKLPLDPPQLEFSRQLSSPRTVYGNKSPATSSTISKVPDEYEKETTTNSVLRPSLLSCHGDSRTNSVFRPSVVSNHGDIGTNSVLRPSVVSSPGAIGTYSMLRPSVLSSPGVIRTNSVLRPSVLSSPGAIRTSSVLRPSLLSSPGAIRTSSVLRPSLLSCQGDIYAADSVNTGNLTSVTKPTVTTTVAQALRPGLASRNTLSGIVCPDRDRQNIAANVIPPEPINLELEGPNHALIVIPEDITEEQQTKQPTEVVIDIAAHNNTPVVLDISNDNNTPVIFDIADDKNTPVVIDISDDNNTPVVHDIADDNNTPVVLDIDNDNNTPVVHDIADDNNTPVVLDIANDNNAPVVHDIADDNNTPVVLDIANDNNTPVVLDIAADNTVPVKNDVLNLFPDVDLAHLDTLCQQHTGHMAVNNICLQLLENEYPKKTDKSRSPEKSENVPNMESIDYYKDYNLIVIPENVVIKYQAQAFQILAQEFLWLSANDIKLVMRKVRSLYAPSYKALQAVWSQAVEIAQKKRTNNSPLVFKGLVFQANIPLEQSGGTNCRMSVKLLKNRRPVIKVHFEVVPELQKEVDFVKQKLKESETEADHKVAVALNEQEYEDQGQCIECGCCYGEYPFEQMVQCYEGHLFCENCLKQYAKESVFGQGKADLICMTELCDSPFPKSQLMKALPSEILVRYEDRVTEENLNLADLGDLVKCPHCEFRAFMDPADKVFRCHNDHCKKESCRYCEVEWEEHFGKKCSEVEKKDETKLRLEYEEKMTKAKVRVCHRCKAQFMKLDGCNKMTCRCGAKMCYICRQPNIDYNHFCRHPRDPGKECTQCNACNLWTNPEEDDNRAIIEMQKEAEEERKKKGYTEARVIGVPDQPPTKKMKR